MSTGRLGTENSSGVAGTWHSSDSETQKGLGRLVRSDVAQADFGFCY